MGGGIMTPAEIIVLGLCLLMFFIGYKIGHRDGYIVGRRAVRKYYESMDKARV
jgi:hypothetical protein